MHNCYRNYMQKEPTTLTPVLLFFCASNSIDINPLNLIYAPPHLMTLNDYLFHTVLMCIFIFYICGSVHHHLINKTTNVMQLVALVFIVPWKALYMFRVLFASIIRSSLKLYMQLLVQSRIGMVSDLVCYKMIRSREHTALCSQLLIIFGVKSTRSMQSAFQGIIKTIAPSCIMLFCFIN
jgi:hypothetical protein